MSLIVPAGELQADELSVEWKELQPILAPAAGQGLHWTRFCHFNMDILLRLQKFPQWGILTVFQRDGNRPPMCGQGAKLPAQGARSMPTGSKLTLGGHVLGEQIRRREAVRQEPGTGGGLPGMDSCTVRGTAVSDYGKRHKEPLPASPLRKPSSWRKCPQNYSQAGIDEPPRSVWNCQASEQVPAGSWPKQ